MTGDRRGYRPIPYAMEEELRALPPAQRGVLISIAFLAAWEAQTIDVDGVRVTLDVGEALVSARGHAALLRLGSGAKGASLFRRALDGGRRLGLISTRPARPKGDAPPDAPPDAPRDAPCDAPPTIVRFLRHRAILWPASKGDAPHDAPGDAPHDAPGDAPPAALVDAIPRDPENKRAEGTTATRSAPRVRRPRKSIDEKPEGTGPDCVEKLNHRAVWEMLERVHVEVRGRPYPRSPGQDAAAVKRLRGYGDATMAEVERRWRRGLQASPGFLRCEVFADLATHRRWAALADETAPPRGRGAAIPVSDWSKETEFGNVPFNQRRRRGAAIPVGDWANDKDPAGAVPFNEPNE